MKMYVSHNLKYLCFFMLVVMNAGAIYYVMLKGTTKGYNWQQNYLQLYFLSFVSDILFVQVVDILWTEVFLPRMIMSHVQEMKTKIIKKAELLTAEIPEEQSWGHQVDSKCDVEGLNSVALAKQEPSLPESRLVLYYNKELMNPSQLLQTDVWWLIASLPLAIHKTLAGIIASLIVTMLIFLWFLSPWLLFAGFVMIGIGVALLLHLQHQSIHHDPAAVNPSNPAASDNNEDGDISISLEDVSMSTFSGQVFYDNEGKYSEDEPISSSQSYVYEPKAASLLSSDLYDEDCNKEQEDRHVNAKGISLEGDDDVKLSQDDILSSDNDPSDFNDYDEDDMVFTDSSF